MSVQYPSIIIQILDYLLKYVLFLSQTIKDLLEVRKIEPGYVIFQSPLKVSIE